MLRIKPTREWNSFYQIFGREIVKRFNWFQFEFGKRMTCLVHQELLSRVSDIKGSKHYKKRIVVAELRRSGNRSWWAIVTKAKSLQEGNYESDKTLFSVVPRFELTDDNPIKVLEKFGPFTVETIPYVPTLREAQIVAERATPDRVDRVRERNHAESNVVSSQLQQLGVQYDPRLAVYKKLRVVENLEALALGLEFGLVDGGKPHWRPAIRFAHRRGVTILKTDRDLIKVMTNSNFRRFSRLKHFRVKIKPSEVKALRRFQNKVFGKRGRGRV